jgi:hypothetical protein
MKENNALFNEIDIPSEEILVSLTLLSKPQVNKSPLQQPIKKNCKIQPV